MEGIKNPRRISANKESRLALLARIREAKEKGEKLRIEKQVEAVYETVDENEYSELVRKRLEDDWIVDDDGGGYAEDGREIFDDNDEDEQYTSSTRRDKTGSKNESQSKKRRFNPDIQAKGSSSSSSKTDIRTLFASSVPKSHKKHKDSENLLNDPNLDDLLAELTESEPAVPSRSNPFARTPKQPGRSYPDHPPTSPVTTTRTSSTHRPTVTATPQNTPIARSQPPKVSSVDSGHSAQERHSSKEVDLRDTKIQAKRTTAPVRDSPRPPIKTPKPIEVLPKTALPVSLDESEPDFEMAELDEEFPAETSQIEPSTAQNHPIPTPTLKPSSQPDSSEASAWFVAEQSAANEQLTSVQTDDPRQTNFPDSSSSDVLHFYWLDAYEDNRFLPGVVYLFGKCRDPSNAGQFVSSCIRIKDLERKIYLLPRSEPSEDGTTFSTKDVYLEFRDLIAQHNIKKFRCKTTTKQYVFDLPDVPEEAEYLEVRYPGQCPALPSDLKGQSFSRIFGTSTSFLENLILDLHLRGPCWLQIKNASSVQPQFSWCRLDYEVSWTSDSKCPVAKLSTVLEQDSQNKNPNDMLPGPPPLCIVAMNIKSVTQERSSHSEIISIGLLINNNYIMDKPNSNLFNSHYLVLAPPKDAAFPYDLRTKLPSYGPQYCAPPPQWPVGGQPSCSNNHPKSNQTLFGGVDIESNERALLGRFLTRLHKLDPDVLIGHDLWGHQVELLFQRLQANKIPHWHRIGRLRRSAAFPINAASKSWLIRQALPGRLVCDTRHSARELVRSRTYNLSDLAHQILSHDSGPTKSVRRQVPPLILKQLNCPTSSASASDESLTNVELADMEIDSADLRCLFASSELMRQLIDFCLSDVNLVLRLAYQLQALPLAIQITTICGNTLSRTLSGGRAERNEALLLHAFTNQGFIVPDPLVLNSRGRGRMAGQNEEWDVHQDGNDEEDRGAAAANAATGRRKPAYTGGLVLEPKKGFYDTYILLLDFNSLYPSIIQEFNLCFTTVDRELVTGKSTNGTNETLDLDSMVTVLLSGIEGDNSHLASSSGRTLRLPTKGSPGLLPAEIRRLVESRREVKKLLSAAAASGSVDPSQRAQWDIRQMALKLTANSVYGCLGFNASRFCARGLAALVTGLGRAVLMNTKELVENMNLEVIYGDTDSIMVNTNTTNLLAALSIGEKVRQEVNKRYRLLELDTDGVYAAMLLLAKKKYAALAIVNPIHWASTAKAIIAQGQPAPPNPGTKQEMKGLDIVRRDWSALAVAVGRRCVAALLSGDSKEAVLDRIHTDLTETAEKVRTGKLPLTDYVITKMLTKNPEDYADAKSLPHVQVALRLNGGCSETTNAKNRLFRAGDTVEYVICDDGSGLMSAQRGYSPGEVMDSAKRATDDNKANALTTSKPLTIDVNYYLAHQIHPVVSRLVAPIEGTSPARIADCLGLDPSSYRRTAAQTRLDEDAENMDGQMASGIGGFSLTSFGDVDPFQIECPQKCNGPPISLKSSALSTFGSGWTCPTCSHNLLQSAQSTRLVTNRLIAKARQLVIRYELGWLGCEDPTCGLFIRTLFCPPSSTQNDLATGTGLWGRGGRPMCPNCAGQAQLKQNYSENCLYRQLCFFRYLVGGNSNPGDVDTSLPTQTLRLLNQCRAYFDSLLSHSAFAMVDLGKIFSGLRVFNIRTGGAV